MEEMARRRGARYWLQKTGPEQALALARLLPTARWIVIERDRIERLRSNFYLLHQGRGKVPLRMIASQARQERMLAGVLKATTAAHVPFHALRSDAEGTMRRLCDHIGVRFDPAMLTTRFRKNTSFRTEAARSFQFSTAAKLRIRALSSVVGSLPG